MANVSSFSGAMPVIPGGLVELGYSQITSNVSVSSASVGSPTTVISPITIVTDGSPLLVEFYAPFVAIGATSNSYTLLNISVDGSVSGRLMSYTNATGGSIAGPVYVQRRLTLSAGSHTIGIVGWYSVSAGTVGAGDASAADATVPAFLRVSKITQPNNGLKPFWTPPIVTQLPTQATVGDQVIYAADATNGVYWHLSYDGIGTYPWKFIGGADLYSIVTTGESRSVASYAALATAGPSITLPLPGDYMVGIGCGVATASASQVGSAMSFTVGATAASDTDAVWAQVVAPGFNVSVSKRVKKSGLSAVALVAQYKASSAVSVTWADRHMSVTPIRVSA